MSDQVVDASVAVKWVVQEPGSLEAGALRRHHRLHAPDLLVADCVNILWKKVRRNELSPEMALTAASLLERAEIALSSMRQLAKDATEIAIGLDHPGYDCLYLALARSLGCQFVTADEALLRKVSAAKIPISVASLYEVERPT